MDGGWWMGMRFWWNLPPGLEVVEVGGRRVEGVGLEVFEVKRWDGFSCVFFALPEKTFG